MTEAEWLKSEDPEAMLAWATAPAPPGGHRPPRRDWYPSARKLRLIACAFRRAGKYEGWGPGGYDQWEDDDHVIPPHHAQPLEMAYSFSRPGVAANARSPACAALLREIVGNPFRPVKNWKPYPYFLDASCTGWPRRRTTSGRGGGVGRATGANPTSGNKGGAEG